MHDYLAMILDYPKDGTIKVDLLEEFPFLITGKSTMPWGEKLFKVNKPRKESFIHLS